MPSLNETIAIIRVEEERRSVMLEKNDEDGFAMVTTTTKPSVMKVNNLTIFPSQST